jgi:histidinol-phosphate aminotransferase
MIVLESEQDVNYLFQQLLRRGVIVRPLGAFGLANCIRISVGTDEENHTLIGQLQQVLATSDVKLS